MPTEWQRRYAGDDPSELNPRESVQEMVRKAFGGKRAPASQQPVQPPPQEPSTTPAKDDLAEMTPMERHRRLDKMRQRGTGEGSFEEYMEKLGKE